MNFYFDIVLKEQNSFKQDDISRKLLSEVTSQQTVSSAHLLPAYFPTSNTHKATKTACDWPVVTRSCYFPSWGPYHRRKNTSVPDTWYEKVCYCPWALFSKSHGQWTFWSWHHSHGQVSDTFSWPPTHHGKFIPSNHGRVMHMFVLSHRRQENRWVGLTVEGHSRAPCEDRPGAALCWTQSVPASSAMDPLWVTAEPISQAAGTLGKHMQERAKMLGGTGQRNRERRAVRSSGRGGRRGKNKKARAVGSVPHWIRNVPKGTVVRGAPRSGRGKEPSPDFSLVCHPVPPWRDCAPPAEKHSRRRCLKWRCGDQESEREQSEAESERVGEKLVFL